MRYPLSKHADILSKTGKRQSEITLEAVKRGEISSEDIKISKDTLLKQGNIAAEHGRAHLGRNLERAAELTEIPDDILLEMYGKLRPFRATKNELMHMADELLTKYNAPINAKLVSDAAEIYEKRGILK